jgi:hypothetical protein
MRRTAIIGIALVLAAVITLLTMVFVHRLIQAVYGEPAGTGSGIIWLVKPHPQKPYAH